MVLLFSAVALHLLGLVAAQKEFNITVTDMSPTIAYTPQQPGLASDAWNHTYANTPWSEYTNTTGGDGATLHTTTLVGATAELGFAGIAVAFYGSGSGKLVLTVDGETEDVTFEAGEAGSQVQLLAARDSLSFGYHTASIKLTSGSLSLARVAATTYIGAEAARPLFKNVSAMEEATYGDATVEVQGTWQPNQSFCGYNDTSTSCVNYPSIGTDTPNAYVTIGTPPNVSVVYIRGNVGVEYSPYSVFVDPAPPFVTSAEVNYNCSMPWRDYDIVLYSALLDPTLRYNITVQNLGSSNQVFELGRAVFLTLNGGEPWSPTSEVGDNSTVEADGSSNTDNNGDGGDGVPIGTIVGAAVGGAAGLLIIGLLLWFCCRRKRAKSPGSLSPKTEMAAVSRNKRSLFGSRSRRSDLSDFEIDTLDQTGQPAQAGNYAVLPSVSNHQLMPDGEGQVTPLPVPLSSPSVPMSVTTKSSMNTPQDSAVGSSPTGTAPVTPLDSIAPLSTFGARTFGVPHSSQPSASSSGPAKSRLPQPSSPAIIQAEDAGRVQSAPRVEEEVVPPQYNPAWARE